MKTRRILRMSGVGAAGSVGVIALLYATIEQPAPVNPMKLVVSRVALGATADAADAAMGMPPVSVADCDGYLLNSETMLVAENQLAPRDQIETYSLRMYRNNGDYAVVAMDSDGQVAGRWAGSIE